MSGVKGRSGTNKGKDKPWAEALRMALFAGDRRDLRAIAEVCKASALAGDMQAIKEIGDRLDGKPVQESDVTIHRDVPEMTDAEIAERIAELRGIGVIEDDAVAPLDPSKLN